MKVGDSKLNTKTESLRKKLALALSSHSSMGSPSNHLAEFQRWTLLAYDNVKLWSLGQMRHILDALEMCVLDRVCFLFPSEVVYVGLCFWTRQ